MWQIFQGVTVHLTGTLYCKKLLLLMNCKNPIIEIQDHIFKITIDFSPLLIKK